jgi:hypothetical protein
MIIANPIYDVVFKYIMKDMKIAKFMLSKLLGKNIVDISYNSDELTDKNEYKGVVKRIEQELDFSVCYMDFSATVEDASGNKELIIIELQKAKFHTDITRFRHYLGSQYMNADHNYVTQIDNETAVMRGRHIHSIYFLGHKLSHRNYSNRLIVKYNKQAIDGITNEIIEKGEDPFIDSLTHDSTFIQIPNITNQGRRTELELLLSIFDQAPNKALDAKKHLLELDESLYSIEYRSLLRKLVQAGKNAKVASDMEKEDIVLDEIERHKQNYLDAKKALKQKDQALEQKDQALEQKDQALERSVAVIMKISGCSRAEAIKQIK